MKKFLKEFKEFAVKGNVMDLAVAFVVGGAFSKIVASLVNDVIMPTIGMISGGIDLTKLSIKVGEVTLTYGNFLQSIIDFVIIAFCIFLTVKAMSVVVKRKKKEAKPNKEVQLLEEIRDLLKK